MDEQHQQNGTPETKAPFDPHRPQEQIKGESAIAFDHFTQYLNMYPRDYYQLATEVENLRKEHGDRDQQGKLIHPQARTLLIWVNKYHWEERAKRYDEIRSEESEVASRAIREKNYQLFFTNELEMVLDVQKLVKEALKKCESMTDLEQQSQIVWKFMKTHMDVRAILKEMFADHIDSERKRTAAEQSEGEITTPAHSTTPSLADDSTITNV